jgi:tetratricopeptide (TPR) repeat protein
VIQTITAPAARSAFRPSQSFGETLRAGKWRIAVVCLGLIAATMLVYSRAGSLNFIDYDDPAMVLDNSHVKSGLTLDNVGWAFTNLNLYYWHPLTYLSHMLDCQLFGLNPGPPHIENAVYHVLNGALLFLLLLRLTGFLWRSALAAAIFALHPLRVESVAWITERRDLLCGLFAILALFAYAYYAEQPSSKKRMGLVFGLFVLALMSKPMAVTLPFVMLLLDYWPLKRFGLERPRALVIEKIPLFGAAVFSAVLTMIGNSSSVITLDVLPFRERVGSAFAAYTGYLGKLLWPRALAVFYPHVPPEGATLVIAGLVFVLLTAAAMQNRRSRPYLVTGWLWFIVMLFPVIGLVQSGGQFMADRFTYLPLIGPVVALVWIAAEYLAKKAELRKVSIVAAAVLLGILGWLSFRQTGYWIDKYTVYRHTLAVTKDNERMWYFYAKALAADGYLDESEKAYREAVRLTPRRGDDHESLALLLSQEGKTAEAIQQFKEVIRLEPENVTVLRYLSLALIQSGSEADAMAYLKMAMRIAPDDPGVRQLVVLARTMIPANQPDATVSIASVPQGEQGAGAPKGLSWTSLTADEALELGFLLGLIAVAVIWPRWGSDWFTKFERALAQMAVNPVRTMLIVAAAPMVIRLLYLPIYPIPEPAVHDEFGYLLLGDTFAAGRLTNPPHAMAEHLESIYVLQHPTYTSYYPFAPGLMLAPALLLGLSPWFAVWLSVGIMCAVFYWMLSGWMPPRWALLGALMAGARLGVLSHWMNSYWGGAVAAIGGALVFGALPRIFRGRGTAYAIVLGVGIAILVQSRPYESLLMSIPVGIALLTWILRTKTPNLGSRLTRFALPFAAVLVSAGTLFAYYNWRVTGNAFQLPYQLYQKLYGVPQSFYWQPPLPPGKSGKFADIQQVYDWQLASYNVRRSWSELSGVTSQKLRALWAFYLQPVWSLPLLAVPWLWPQKRLRVLLVSIAILLAGVLLYPFFFPHYLAPVCGAFLIIVTYSLRRMRLWEWRGRPVGAALMRAVVVVSAACLVIAPAGEYLMSGARLVHTGTPRQKILNTLESKAGKHLIFVHYGPKHVFHNGVINNAADTDNSRVVWARDMGPEKNQELLRYYPDRTAWKFEADDWPVHLLPYTADQ